MTTPSDDDIIALYRGRAGLPGSTFTELKAAILASVPPPTPPVPVEDEGSLVVADPSALNFTGAGVTATDAAGVATIDIPGSSGPIVKVSGEVIQSIPAGATPVTITDLLFAAGEAPLGLYTLELILKITGGANTSGITMKFTGASGFFSGGVSSGLYRYGKNTAGTSFDNVRTTAQLNLNEAIGTLPAAGAIAVIVLSASIKITDDVTAWGPQIVAAADAIPIQPGSCIRLTAAP